MAALVMLVLLVCACSLFCELFQRRLEEVVPLAACAIVLLMYGFALAGLLRAGALVALGLCAASLPAALILAVKRRGLRALLGRLLTPAALIYVLLCLASLVANAGKPVHTWDEFTYWADAVKIMTLQGVLPADAAARSLFGSYPPALPLWQYLAQTVNGLLGMDWAVPGIRLLHALPARGAAEASAGMAGPGSGCAAVRARCLSARAGPFACGYDGGCAGWLRLRVAAAVFRAGSLFTADAVRVAGGTDAVQGCGTPLCVGRGCGGLRMPAHAGKRTGSCARKCGPARVVAACLRGGGAPHMERICNGHGRGGAGHLLRSGQFERVALAGGCMAAYHTAQFSLQIF